MNTSEKNLNRTIAQIWNEYYVIPLYQRNFAWTEEQIGQLLQDLYDHAPKSESEKLSCGNYYLGSLVLLKRHDGKWEVIDGQQRLTALHLICRFLNILKSPRLTFDSRPTVKRFLDDLFSTKSWADISKESLKTEDNKTLRLRDALSIVSTYKIRMDDKGNTVSLDSMPDYQKRLLAEYICSRVILVCTPLPEDTDVASYFEIMNNRGEQLQSHEIVKAILMRSLNNNSQKVFADIWDACSQMDRPIQRSLSAIRVKIFGDKYDTFSTDDLLNSEDSQNSLSDSYEIDEILSADFELHESFINESSNIDTNYRAIIDFPNFLMHVFRLYADKRGSNITVPLNSDFIPVSQPEYIHDSMDFVKFLLKIRVLFDRYVIKVQGLDDDSEDLKWRMLKPYKDSQGILRFRNTFSTEEPSDHDEEFDAGNNRIIKQQSLLQVSFRNRKYKEWLSSLLSWLDKQTLESINVNELELARFLDNWIYNYYSELANIWDVSNEKKEGTKNLLAAGIDTPHFLFNYIDYLYWLAAQKRLSSVRYINKIQDFQFRYYNSVEHHLPQSYEQTNDVDIDLIGNLCLISRRKNSSLNDKGPTEKAKIEQGLLPKRRVMYEITHDNQQWSRKEIENHQKDIIELLEQSESLLLIC